MAYAVIKRDGTYVRGELPENVERDKFCIMCAAAYGAGLTAHREYGDEVEEVIIKGKKHDVIIGMVGNELLAVIGTKEDYEKIAKEIRA